MKPNLCPLEKSDFDEIVAAFKKVGWNKPKDIYEAYFKEQSDGIRSIILAKVNEKFCGYVTINKRLAITCDVDNERSKKVPERLGYSLESTMKANRVKPITGEVTDTLVFARTNLINLPELKVSWKYEN